MHDVENNGVVRMLQQVAWSYGRMEGWSYFESLAGEEDDKKATDQGDEKVKDYHSNFMNTYNFLNKDEDTAGKKVN